MQWVAVASCALGGYVNKFSRRRGDVSAIERIDWRSFGEVSSKSDRWIARTKQLKLLVGLGRHGGPTFIKRPRFRVVLVIQPIVFRFESATLYNFQLRSQPLPRAAPENLFSMSFGGGKVRMVTPKNRGFH